MKSIYYLLLILFLGSCTDIKDKPISIQTFSNDINELKLKHSNSYSNEDFETLSNFMTGYALVTKVNPESSKSFNDITYGYILDSARTNRLRLDSIKTEFYNNMDIHFIGHSIQNVNYNDYLLVGTKIENKSEKIISDIKGEVYFINQFGDTIDVFEYIHSEDIAPKSVKDSIITTWDVSFIGSSKVNQITALTPDKTEYIFKGKVIVFKDGTKIERD